MNRSGAALAMAFSNVGHSFSHLFMLLYPTVVLALEPEMGLGYGELIVLMTAGNALFGLAALPAGWLGDRWSAPGMMVAFFCGVGVASVLTGLASTPLGIALGLALIGLFAAIYHPVGMAWLVRNAVNRGRALGFNGVFGSLGVAAAALVAGALTDFYGWRAAFIVPGVISALVGLALLACLRTGLLADTRVDAVPGPAVPRGAMVRAFFVLSVTMLCAGLIYQAMSAALPKLFAERLVDWTRGSALGAGGLVSLVYLVAAGAQILGGHLADRLRLRALYTLQYVVLVPLLMACASLGGSAMFVAVATAVFLNTSAIPVENVLLAHYAPARWRGTAFGAKFVLSLGVASLGVPLVALTHGASGGFYWLFMALAAASAVLVLAALALPDEAACSAGPVIAEPARGKS